MAYNLISKAKQYIDGIPERSTLDVDAAFMLLEAFIAGHYEGSSYETKKSIYEDTYSMIILIASAHYGQTPKQINANDRARELVQTRQICMYLADKFTNLSDEAIAKKFGKSRSTTIHSVKTVTNLIETEEIIARDIKKIESQIKMKIIE